MCSVNILHIDDACLLRLHEFDYMFNSINAFKRAISDSPFANQLLISYFHFPRILNQLGITEVSRRHLIIIYEAREAFA